MISSKYRVARNGWDANPTTTGSSRNPQKDISSGHHSFLQCCRFEVGSRDRVRFWEDNCFILLLPVFWVVGQQLIATALHQIGTKAKLNPCSTSWLDLLEVTC